MLQEQEMTDILNLEFQLQKTINELQWKSKALIDAQKDSLQIRQQLLSNELIAEEQKRTINDLRMQLTAAHHVIKAMEQEKIQYTNEKTELQINCNAAVKERESLLEQTHAAKMENVTLKLSVQKLTEIIATNESVKNSFGSSMSEMQERFSQINNFLQCNVAKLEKEQKLLLKSVESTVEINKRLETVGLCAHAIFSKKNEEIKYLQNEVLSNVEANSKLRQIHPAEVTDVQKRNKFDAKEILKQVRVDAVKDYETDKEVDAILANFNNVL